MKKYIRTFRDEYSFLSNFSPNPILYKGIVYTTSEHAYQATKAKTIEDHDYIAESKSAGESKKRGQEIEIREDWEDVKYNMMLDILHAKFSTPKMKQKLIDTDPFYLVEGNVWHDNTWGDCTCSACRDIPGLNLLGKALMETRKKLKGQTILF